MLMENFFGCHVGDMGEGHAAAERVKILPCHRNKVRIAAHPIIKTW